jgi:hypothetical protein
MENHFKINKITLTRSCEGDVDHDMVLMTTPAVTSGL